MKKLIQSTSISIVALMISISALAQETRPVASPKQTATGKIKDANITINYGSPAVKGRTIWGSLEPYDKVWRAGANDATTFETDQDLTVQGKPLPKGKYTFFLIPQESGTWIAIFNKVQKQWGAFTYKESEDQLRVPVTTKPLKETQERLVYNIHNTGFTMEWDKISVPLTVK